MKYYLIFKHTGDPHTRSIYPSYIIEYENVAKDFCKEYSEFYYEERDDGQYIFVTPATLGNSIELGKSADVCSDINPLSKGIYSDIKCPYCGKAHFQVGGSMTTAIYCPVIVKDGKVVNENNNVSTTYYYCQECNRRFKSVNGEVQKDGN